MPSLTGRLNPRHGAMLHVKIMQSPAYVDALKKAGRPFSSPETVLALLDTGASATAVDRHLIGRMSLQYRDVVSIHTPTTGSTCATRAQYDATLVIGETESPPLTATIPVIESEFAHQGFHVLIGRDILNRCILTYDGPAGTFTLVW